MEEIQRSPVEVGSLSDYVQGFLYIPGGCLGRLPPTVCTVTPYPTKKREKQKRKIISSKKLFFCFKGDMDSFLLEGNLKSLKFQVKYFVEPFRGPEGYIPQVCLQFKVKI